MKAVMSKIGSGVKAGGSNTRLNSQSKYFKELASELLMPLASKMDDEKIISSDRIEAHLDWIQFTGDVAAGEQYRLFNAVERLTREVILLRHGKPTQIGNEYQNSGRSLKSVKVAWDNQDDNGRCRVLISVPGKVLSSMPILRVRELALELGGVGLHCTRLDIAIDDFGKRLSFQTVVTALMAKNYALFKTWDFRYSMKGGMTIYFGSRESPRHTKLYDKDIESKGKIKSYRLETKFGSKVADEVLLEWLMIDPDELGSDWEKESTKYLCQSVIGSINFIDRQSKPKEKNLKRIPRLGWYQAFVDLFGEGICHTAPIPEPSLERSTQWHRRSTMRDLACVLMAFEEEAYSWLNHQLEVARRTFSKKHLQKIAQYRLEWNRYKNWKPELALT